MSGSSRLSRDFREIDGDSGRGHRRAQRRVRRDLPTSMLALGVHYSNVGLTSMFRALQKAAADMARHAATAHGAGADAGQPDLRRIN